MSSTFVFYIYHSILTLPSLAFMIIYFGFNKKFMEYVKNNPENTTFSMFCIFIYVISIEIFYTCALFCGTCKKRVNIAIHPAG